MLIRSCVPLLPTAGSMKSPAWIHPFHPAPSVQAPAQLCLRELPAWLRQAELMFRRQASDEQHGEGTPQAGPSPCLQLGRPIPGINIRQHLCQAQHQAPTEDNCCEELSAQHTVASPEGLATHTDQKFSQQDAFLSKF